MTTHEDAGKYQKVDLEEWIAVSDLAMVNGFLRLVLVPIGLLVPVLVLGNQLLEQHLLHAGLDADLVAGAVVAVGHGDYVVWHADLHGDGDVARWHLVIKKL